MSMVRVLLICSEAPVRVTPFPPHFDGVDDALAVLRRQARPARQTQASIEEPF